MKQRADIENLNSRQTGCAFSARKSWQTWRTFGSFWSYQTLIKSRVKLNSGKINYFGIDFCTLSPGGPGNPGIPSSPEIFQIYR
jgi:hypothetical protein